MLFQTNIEPRLAKTKTGCEKTWATSDHCSRLRVRGSSSTTAFSMISSRCLASLARCSSTSSSVDGRGTSWKSWCPVSRNTLSHTSSLSQSSLSVRSNVALRCERRFFHSFLSPMKFRQTCLCRSSRSTPSAPTMVSSGNTAVNPFSAC